jgi:RHS repeat-associated protein
MTRKIPLHDGSVATRHGSGGPWTFEYGEQRGNRFFTDQNGAFVQDVNYQPFGKPTSTGAQPGSQLYSNKQWNGGDALAAFGISQLGARLYDPAIGRFLSRDPLLIPRTAATTNPYAFASNDPVNRSDPSGLDGCNGSGTDKDGNPCVTNDGKQSSSSSGSSSSSYSSGPTSGGTGAGVGTYGGGPNGTAGGGGSGAGENSGSGGAGVSQIDNSSAAALADIARYQTNIQTTTSVALHVMATQQGSFTGDVLGGLYDATKGVQSFGQWAANIFDDVAMGNWLLLAEDIGAPMRNFNEFFWHPADTICANGCVRGVVGIGAPIAIGGLAGTASRAWRAAGGAAQSSVPQGGIRILSWKNWGQPQARPRQII